MADQYHMTDFSQTHDKCPHCNENAVFIRKHINFISISTIPILPRQKEAVAFCRACLNRVDHGTDPKIDMNLQAQLESMPTPKILYFGAVAIPVIILSIFIISSFA